METFKDIKGYEGCYQISNFGNVKSLERNGTIKGDKCLVGSVSRTGYRVVSLCTSLIRKTTTVHRLVLETFCSNENNKPQCNHKDGNKLNNNADNLEWVTASENRQHSYDTGLQESCKGEKHGMSKFTERQIRFIRNLKIWFPNLTNQYIADIYGVSFGCVGTIIRRDSWNHVCAT